MPRRIISAIHLPGNFFNTNSGALDNWFRHFTPEEMGGLETGMVRNTQRTFSITPGIKGRIGDSGWDYEVAFNHSQYESTVSWPEIVAWAPLECW